MDYVVTNSTTSFDTRPHESTWIYGTNYAHARTVDTRPFFRSGWGLGTRLGVSVDEGFVSYKQVAGNVLEA